MQFKSEQNQSKVLAIIAFLAAGLMMVAATPSIAASKIAGGTFEGRSNHITTGTITIKKEAGKTIVVLGPDFSLDGAPAPTLGFANGEKFDLTTEFTKLASKTGEQTYELPANIDPTKYDHFVVWCSKFAVPLGTAALKQYYK